MIEPPSISSSLKKRKHLEYVEFVRQNALLSHQFRDALDLLRPTLEDPHALDPSTTVASSFLFITHFPGHLTCKARPESVFRGHGRRGARRNGGSPAQGLKRVRTSLWVLTLLPSAAFTHDQCCSTAPRTVLSYPNRVSGVYRGCGKDYSERMGGTRPRRWEVRREGHVGVSYRLGGLRPPPEAKKRTLTEEGSDCFNRSRKTQFC